MNDAALNLRFGKRSVDSLTKSCKTVYAKHVRGYADNKTVKIYTSSANVDMRKSIDGLASIVEQKFALNPLSDIMFVFHNRHCEKIKILYWDGNGFCLLYKRIEKGKFRFPQHIAEEKYTVSEEELSWLLQGLHIEEIKYYKKLKTRNFSTEKAV